MRERQRERAGKKEVRECDRLTDTDRERGRKKREADRQAKI